MTRSRLVPLTMAVCCAIALRPESSAACGPFALPIIFVRSNGPDATAESYLNGAVGLIDANYRTDDLAIAYRHLNGLGLDATEKASILASRAPAPYDDEREAVWVAARARVVTTPAHYPSRGFTTEAYEQIDNCSADAFATASRTLAARVASFGAASAQVMRWVAAQDRVFLACSRTETPELEALPPEATVSERRDRDYQRAARAFYLGDYGTALAAFEAIARDPGSEWNATARYLVARVHQRRSYDPGRREPELRAAESALDAILADPSMSGWRPAASRYRDFVRGRLDPPRRISELSVAIASLHQGAELGRMLADLQTLTTPAHAAELDETDRLAVFIACIRSHTDDAARRASRLFRTTHSPAFLVAALTALPSVTALPAMEVDALLDAARAVTPTDPAYVSATAHRARLLLGRPGVDRAAMRRELALTMRTTGDTRGASAAHAFTLLAFAYADSVDDAVAAAGAPVTVAQDTSDPDDVELLPALNELPYDFHVYGKRLLDRLPLSTWSRVARRTSLPEAARADIATVGYLRALLADDAVVRSQLAPLVESRYAPLAREIRAVERARTDDERRYARIWLLLHATSARTELDVRSGLEGDSFTSSAVYFCPRSATDDTDGPFAARLSSALERTASRVGGRSRNPSRASIATLPAAGIFLAREAIVAVNARPDDSRNPELLARAVRATRWACASPGTRAASRDAFQLLHARYAGTNAALRTRYYYGDP